MNCMQITTYGPHVKARSISPSSLLTYSQLCLSPGYPMTSRRLVTNASSYQRCNTVCLFGGERKADNGDEASPWKSLEKAIKGLGKEKSVQELLREQMQKGEFADETGNGIENPPSGGGGGGGGGGDDAGSGSEEEGRWEEAGQVALSIAGFLFVYMYILDSQEMILLLKDIFRFIITRRATLRVARILDFCSDLYVHLTRRKKMAVPDNWLELEILNTPTLWHKPDRVKRELERQLASGYYEK